MAYNFEPKSKARAPKRQVNRGNGSGSRRWQISDKEAGLLLATWTLYIDTPTYEAMGKPSALAVEVDPEHRAMKLTPNDSEYVVRKEITTKAAGTRYRIFNISPQRRKVGIGVTLGDLPLGFYKPVGGGIFEHDPYSARTKIYLEQHKS